MVIICQVDPDALSARHTAIPSQFERNLLERLVHIYDAQVYNPALNWMSRCDGEGRVQESLDALYDVIMIVEEKYKQWWRDVRELGDNHTKPTMRKIFASPVVMQQLEHFEGMKEAANRVGSKSEGYGLRMLSRPNCGACEAECDAAPSSDNTG